MMINNSTLVMVTILAAVAILSAALVVLPTQEVDARSSLKVTQKQSNKCHGFATCTNTGTITIGPGVHGDPH
jgi:hypothetical protein